jgi:DNA-binding helix-hairpin-helix protein with protein kinase domain
MTPATQRKKNEAPHVTNVWGALFSPTGNDSWTPYRIGNRIGKGGMGTVHEFTPASQSPMLAKLFNPAMLARIKGDPKIAMRLAALVAHRDDIANTLGFATWPRRMLFTKQNPRDKREIADTVVGFTMVRLQNTISLQQLLMDPDRRIRLTPEHTAKIAELLTEQISRMHKHKWKFVFGDFSPNNIHVRINFKTVSFIDTDSFQFDFDASKYTFTLGGITPGYKSPGVEDQLKQTGRVTSAHDDFVLAIHLFQLFMLDRQMPRHPFQTLDIPIDTMIAKRAFPFDNPAAYPVPQPCLQAYSTVPPFIRAAFTRTFTTPATVTAEEWAILLADYRRFLRRA